MTDLNKFYSDWSNKPPEEIEFIIKTCIEKSMAALNLLENIDIGPIKSILEVGCGYGRSLVEVVKYTNASYGLGCDFSEDAINYAKKHYESESIRFMRNTSLDIKNTVSQLREIHNQSFDMLILFDILEHIPTPKTFIRELSQITKYFLIKLPLENSIMDNYLLLKPKLYPSALHPDGHLREFHVNDVHHFVVSLGLVPLRYDFYNYDLLLLFPSHIKHRHLKGQLYFEAQKLIKRVTKLILPKRIFLSLIGGGGFICVARWSAESVLE